MNYAIYDAISEDNIIVATVIPEYTYAFDGMSELANTDGKCYAQYQYWNSVKIEEKFKKVKTMTNICCIIHQIMPIWS